MESDKKRNVLDVLNIYSVDGFNLLLAYVLNVYHTQYYYSSKLPYN